MKSRARILNVGRKHTLVRYDQVFNTENIQRQNMARLRETIIKNKTNKKFRK